MVAGGERAGSGADAAAAAEASATGRGGQIACLVSATAVFPSGVRTRWALTAQDEGKLEQNVLAAALSLVVPNIACNVPV